MRQYDDLSAYDFDAELKKVKSLIEHPFIFGAGVGIANGLLAAARGMHMSTRATLATAAVLAIGETVIALDHLTPEQQTPALLGRFAGLSGLGVLMGLAMFTNWRQWAGGPADAVPLLVASNAALSPGQPTMTSAMPSMATATA